MNMAIRKQRLALVVIALLTATAHAAQTPAPPPAPNLTGTWLGKAIATKDGAPGSEEGLYAVLQQVGADVTGTVGPSADRQQDITKGKVTTTKDGTTVAFDTGRSGHVIHFELKLIDSKLKGAVKDETYPETKITLELQRAK